MPKRCECGCPDNLVYPFRPSFDPAERIQQETDGLCRARVGTQGTNEEWHRCRTGRISGSVCRDTAHGVKFETQVGRALAIAGISKRPSLDHIKAIQWGKRHEDLARFLYVDQLRKGTQILHGTLQEHSAMQVHEPDLVVSDDIQGAFSTEVWHLSGSLDGVGWSSARPRGCPLEIKCPYTPDKKRMPAVEYLTLNKAYQVQAQQYAYLLRAPFVDFVTWSDVDGSGAPSSDGRGFLSIFRYRFDMDTFSRGLLTKNHIFASHFVAPLLERLVEQGVHDNPNVDARSKAVDLPKDPRPKRCVGCGAAERLCLEECPPLACTCRCDVLCLRPADLGLFPADMYTPCKEQVPVQQQQRGCRCALELLPDLQAHLEGRKEPRVKPEPKPRRKKENTADSKQLQEGQDGGVEGDQPDEVKQVAEHEAKAKVVRKKKELSEPKKGAEVEEDGNDVKEAKPKPKPNAHSLLVGEFLTKIALEQKAMPAEERMPNNQRMGAAHARCAAYKAEKEAAERLE